MSGDNCAECAVSYPTRRLGRMNPHSRGTAESGEVLLEERQDAPPGVLGLRF